MPIQFHLDEHVERAVADGLRRRGIDVTTSAEANLLAAADERHLAFAESSGRVLLTYDDDFLRLHRRGRPHPGIIYCPPWNREIGRIVRRLVLLHRTRDSQSMRGRVEYI